MPENKKEKNRFSPPLEFAVKPPNPTPETCEEMLNTYGTYNIQPTADTPNDFPAIAQGTPEYMKQRSHKFFRDGKDYNPAHDRADRHPIKD